MCSISLQAFLHVYKINAFISRSMLHTVESLRQSSDILLHDSSLKRKNWGRQCQKEKKISLDKVFFEGETTMHATNAGPRRNTRELHLEMVGDKVTYVRVY